MSGAIPFCVPFRAPREEEYVAEAVRNGLGASNGAFSVRARQLLGGLVGSGKVFLTTSGSAALELATLVGGIGPGDEVLLPSFTFTSVANAIVLRGATPVFVDIEPTTQNIDPARIAEAITPRTRAIIVVHYAGVACDMERILAIARRHGLLVIEDAAHAIGSTLGGRPVGSFGDLAAFSFHHTKNITCGEGGCLVVNRRDLVDRTEIAFEKGTNRTAFFQGVVDKYSWVDVGSSFILSELNAAVLTAQLEAVNEVTGQRLALWNTYRDHCGRFRDQGLVMPSVRKEAQHNGHMFQLLLPTPSMRLDLTAFMRRRGITAPFHYVPLHSAPAGRRFGRTGGTMEVTDDVWGRLIRLPLYPTLGRDAERVLDALSDWVNGRETAAG